MSTRKKLIIFIIALLVIDQVVKIWIKTHMMIGDEFSVFGDWFKIHFIENNGMAFGMELGGGKWGKTVLSVFRLIAVGVSLGTWDVSSKKRHPGGYSLFRVIFCRGIVTSSIAHSTGDLQWQLFTSSYYVSSRGRVLLVPTWQGGRYALFSALRRLSASMVPIWGGDFFVFFRPVFNLADSYITIGVFILLLFHRKYFASKK